MGEKTKLLFTIGAELLRMPGFCPLEIKLGPRARINARDLRQVIVKHTKCYNSPSSTFNTFVFRTSLVTSGSCIPFRFDCQFEQ
jgi:hypothetical protein